MSADVFLYRQQAARQSSAAFFIVNLAKEIFYCRPESEFQIRRLVGREGRKLDLGEEKLSITFENLLNFVNSDFYQSTHPSLVNHISIDDTPQFNIGDRELTGGVHLAWTDRHGKFYSVRISPKGSEVSTAFAALYPLKKFQVIPENINVGALSTQNWQCTWTGLNWHEISEMQDAVLSFVDADDFSAYTATEKISHCEVCDFAQICYRHSSELDLM